jgi:GrpB-like predicted nucleotidyltransferase (UPF0157 family)
VREPELDGHRLFRTPAGDVHVHVYSSGSREIECYRLLRERQEERELYARIKRDLAGRGWRSMDHYADAKTGVIEGIIARATTARSPRRDL